MGETIATDVLVVGAGIAGAGVAAELAGALGVVLLEQENRPGYHSTGRSAALFFQNYGNAAIRALSRASRPLFKAADPKLFPNPLFRLAGRSKLRTKPRARRWRHCLPGLKACARSHQTKPARWCRC